MPAPSRLDSYFEELTKSATLEQIITAQRLAIELLNLPDGITPIQSRVDETANKIAKKLLKLYKEGIKPEDLDAKLQPYLDSQKSPENFESYLQTLNTTKEEKSILKKIVKEKLIGDLKVSEKLVQDGDKITFETSKTIHIPANIKDLDENSICTNLLRELKEVIKNPQTSKIKIEFKKIDILPEVQPMRDKDKAPFCRIADQSDPYKTATEELRKAGITLITESKDGSGKMELEQFNCFLGKLNNFKFKRAWGYWIVEGEITLDLAERIYETEIGKKYIRLGGWAGNQIPAEAAKYYNRDQTLMDGTEKVDNIYHIDTQEALNLFVKIVKQFNSKLRRIK